MEVVAGVASVAQLIVNAITLVTAIADLQEQIEGRPALLRQRVRQLESLGNTVEAVSKNSWLRTPTIREHIDIILSRVHYLTSLLEKEITRQKQSLARKYLRVWLGASGEQKILDAFTDLESGKSALLLSIAEAQTELTGDIHNTLTQGSQTYRGAPWAQGVRLPLSYEVSHVGRMSSNLGTQAPQNSRNSKTKPKEISRKTTKRPSAFGVPNTSGNNDQEEGGISHNHGSGSSGVVAVRKDKGRKLERAPNLIGCD